ncbi:hypothetical protein SBDP2_860004 [Syntrophobacter sp. SbD2]|nr:hypothetical protein SBDP2_860004 [Syntrophobacter sp. SbD2]
MFPFIKGKGKVCLVAMRVATQSVRVLSKTSPKYRRYQNGPMSIDVKIWLKAINQNTAFHRGGICPYEYLSQSMTRRTITGTTAIET